MVSPYQDLIDHLNDRLEDHMSENISTKYFEPYELTLTYLTLLV